MAFKTKAQKIASSVRKEHVVHESKPTTSASSHGYSISDLRKTLILTVTIGLLLAVLSVMQMKNYF